LKENVTIYTSAKENQPLTIAIKALQRDIKKVTGLESTVKPLSAIDKTGIVILDASKTQYLKLQFLLGKHIIFIQRK
jgi:hypothetical protein